MSVSSAARYDIPSSVSNQPPRYVEYPVKAATAIYEGTLVMLVGGYAKPLLDASGGVFVGMAEQTVTGGAADGDVNIRVKPAGAMRTIDLNATSPNVAAWLGKQVCAVDDNTVDLPGNTTHDVYVGTVIEVLSTAVAGKVRVACVDTTLNQTIQSAVLSTLIADPGNGQAIPVTGSGYCPLVTAGAETRTLAIPTVAGQMIKLEMKTDQGNCVVTVAQAIDQLGTTVLTFDDAGDMVVLVAIYVGTALRWRVLAVDGVEFALPREAVTVLAADTLALTGKDNGGYFTNEGAAAAVTFTLPAATVGLRYTFYVMAAQELRIDPNGSETIAIAGAQQVGGKYVTANAVGEFVELLCVKAGQWDDVSARGTWTAQG